MTRPVRIVTLCTGNAARSVMAGVMLEQLAEHEGAAVEIVTAGTHVVEGQPMGMRTKQALVAVGELDTAGLGRHRSHQLTDADCAWADVIVAMEADHVAYVRARHDAAGHKTATIHRLARALPVSPEPFGDRVTALNLASTDLAADRDVLDPAGGDQEDYDRCAAEIFELCQVLIALVGVPPG